MTAWATPIDPTHAVESKLADGPTALPLRSNPSPSRMTLWYHAFVAVDLFGLVKVVDEQQRVVARVELLPHVQVRTMPESA